MEVFIGIAGAVVLVITSWRAYEAFRTRRRLRALASGAAPLVEDVGVAGHTTHGGWHFIDVRADSGERYDRWVYRSTVQGVLPDWLMMDWCARRPESRAGSPAFLPEALFGAEALAQIPQDWTVLAEHGDLVVQSEERYRVQVPRRPLVQADATSRRLTHAFSSRGLDGFASALAEAVDVQGQAEALRLLCLRFADQPRTERLARESLGHEIAGVRVVAARHLGAEGHETLVAVALDPELPVEVRREACRALASRRDHERLLEVGMSASGGVEDVVAEALGGWPDPRVEGVVLPFLDRESEVVVEAAVGALAQQGTAASIAALEARLARRAGGPLKTALHVALDLIRERAGGSRGGLALVPDPEARPEVGRVSMLGRDRGRLSEPDEATDDEP